MLTIAAPKGKHMFSYFLLSLAFLAGILTDTACLYAHTGEAHFTLKASTQNGFIDPNKIESMASLYFHDLDSWTAAGEESLNQTYLSLSIQNIDEYQIPSLEITYDESASPALIVSSSYDPKFSREKIKVISPKKNEFQISDNHISLTLKLAGNPCKNDAKMCSLTLSSWSIAQLSKLGTKRAIAKISTVISSDTNLFFLNAENGQIWHMVTLANDLKQKLGKFVNATYFKEGLSKLDFIYGSLYMNFKMDLVTAIFPGGILKQQTHMANAGRLNPLGEYLFTNTSHESLLVSDEQTLIWQKKALLFDMNVDLALLADRLPQELIFDTPLFSASISAQKDFMSILAVSEISSSASESSLIYSRYRIEGKKIEKNDFAVTVSSRKNVYLFNDGFYFLKAKNGLYYLNSQGKASPTSFTQNGDQIIQYSPRDLLIQTSENNTCVLKVLAGNSEHLASFGEIGVKSSCLGTANFSRSAKGQLLSSLNVESPAKVTFHLYYNVE